MDSITKEIPRLIKKLVEAFPDRHIDISCQWQFFNHTKENQKTYSVYVAEENALFGKITSLKSLKKYVDFIIENEPDRHFCVIHGPHDGDCPRC